MKHIKTFKVALFATAAMALVVGSQAAKATDLITTVTVEVLSATTTARVNDLDLGTYVLQTNGTDAVSVIVAPATGIATNGSNGGSSMTLIGSTTIPQVGQVSVTGALATTTMNVSHTPSTVTLSCDGEGSCTPANEDLQLVIADSSTAGVITTNGDGDATVNIAGTLGPVNTAAVTADWFDETYTGTFVTTIDY